MTSPGVSHPGVIACAVGRAGATGAVVADDAARAAPGNRIAQQPTIAAASRRPVRVVMFMVPPYRQGGPAMPPRQRPSLVGTLPFLTVGRSAGCTSPARDSRL